MLTVTADDFGIGYETSRGIVDAHLAGAVDATSVMTVTGDHLGRSLSLLDRAPRLHLGLHLTLTSRAGKPLVATAASGLVGREGGFRSLPELLVRTRCGRVSRSAVTEEILAQHDRFCRVIGRKPDHLDGHHHTHQAPIVRDAIADLLRRGLLPRRVRCTRPPPMLQGAGVPRVGLRRLIVHRLGRESRPLFHDAGANIDRLFCGLLSPGALRQSNPWLHEVDAVFSAEPPAHALPVHVELMTHPGHPDETLVGRDAYQRERATELAALLAWGPIRTRGDRPELLPPVLPSGLDPCAGEGMTVPL